MRTLMRNFGARVARRSPNTILTIGLIYMLALSLLDCLTPSMMGFTLFYVVGTVFVGWAGGRRPVILVSLACCVLVGFHDVVLARNPQTPVWLVIWNTSTRFVIVGMSGFAAAEVARLTGELGRMVEERTAQWETEVTSKKQAEEVVQMQARVLESLGEAVVVADEQGAIILTNWVLDSAFGYARGELIGRPLFTLSGQHPDQLRQEFLRVFQSVQTQDLVIGEYKARRKDGSELQVRTRSSRMHLGDRRFMILVGEDITEQKRAEQALADAVELNRKMLEASAMGIVAYKASGECVFANEAIARIAGGTVEHILQGNFRQLPNWQHSGMLRLAQDSLDKGVPLSGEFHDFSRFGKRGWVDGHMAPFVSGGQLHLLHMAYDITERRRAEQQLLEISDREQARIGQDLHDGLCQQLVGLAFDANALQRKLSSQQRPEAPMANRIADLLDQAITESRRLSRGLFPIRLETEGLVSALQELARATSERFGLQCHLEVNGAVTLKDKATATHLYRIAQEGVSNAVKHGTPGSITISLRATDQTLELKVQDDGNGCVSPAGHKQAGMGLHIMRYRAKAIGATLDFCARPQIGATLRCTLPSSTNAQAVDNDTLTSKPGPRPGFVEVAADFVV